MNPLRLFTLLALTLAAAHADPIRVACTGDSLTQGAKVNAATESYPAQLQQMLGDKFEVKNFGVGGATMMQHGKPNAFQQLPQVKAYSPHIVVVAFGTNDTRSRGVDYWNHVDEFVPDATKLIGELTKLPTSPRILLCLPASHMADLPGMAGDRKEVNAERVPRMEEIRAKLRTLAASLAKKNVTLVDLEAPTRGKTELFDLDGVHMKPAGYRVLAEALKPAIESAAPSLKK